MNIHDAELAVFCRCMVDSYLKFAGQPLIDYKPNNLVQALYEVGFVLVAHRTEADPVFYFANQTAQKLWEMDWEEFTRTPSKQSVPEAERAERQALLDAAQANNIIQNYHGTRVTKSGRLFRIKDVTLWNVFNTGNTLIGQAACFDRNLVEFIN